MAKGQKSSVSANDQNEIRRAKKQAQKKGKKKSFGQSSEPSIFQAIKLDKKEARDRQRVWEAAGREIHTLINSWLDKADEVAKTVKVVRVPLTNDQHLQACHELVGWLNSDAGRERYFVDYIGSNGVQSLLLTKNADYRAYKPRHRRQAA